MGSAELHAAAQGKPSLTPITESSTFAITQKDVGTLAVRPGCMAEVEQERLLLLNAAKLILATLKAGKPAGPSYQFILEAAVRAAEARGR
jgi:hypothetical protein